MTNAGRMFSGFIIVLLGLYLTPSVSTAVADAVNATSGAAEKALLGLVTILWVVGVIAGAAKVAGISFSN